MRRIILHIDMNSYFASVEQQANPFLRGKPVGVCAYLSPRGCIIASSIEAKKLGIKTGMRVCDAQALYSKIILVENEPAKYRSVTERIFSILADYTDRLEPYSIDEAFLDLTGWVSPKSAVGAIHESPLQSAYITALQIKHRIQTEVGEWLKCSIGISWTRWLAKFASDIAQKDSILMITPDTLDNIFSRAHLTDAWGIKQRMEFRLNKLGIYTLNDLKNYPVSNLLQTLGRYGYYLWANVNGIEISAALHPRESAALPKSIGHQCALAKKTTDLKFLRGVLMKLCEKTGRRLRSYKMEARSISPALVFVGGGGIYKTKKLPEPLFTTASIYQAAEKILFSCPLPDRARLLAVSVGNLVPMNNQLSLFKDIYDLSSNCHCEEPGQKQIALALDALNEKFGEYTITSGEMLGAQNFAIDRIGFRKIEL